MGTGRLPAIGSIAAIAMLTACAAIPTDGPGLSSRQSSANASGKSSPASREPWNRPNATKLYVAPKAPLRPLTDSGDLTCKQLVAPFELTGNLEILQGLGVDGVLQAMQQVWETMIRGTSAELAVKTVGKEAKHGIPYHLRAAAYQMNWIPMELEVAYGEELARQLNEAGEIEPLETESGPKLYAAADELLAQTLAAVSEPHPYAFRAVVTTRAGQNAEALPGGLILVDPALLKDRTLSRKAKFAMAHEVGHVLQRHQTRAMQARIIDTISLKSSLPDLAKVMGESKSSPKAVISLILAGKLQFEKFFVEQELHSDGCAVRILNRTQSNRTELLAVVQDFVSRLPKAVEAKTEPTVAPANNSPLVALQKTAKNADSVIDLVSRPIERHPTTVERLKNLNQTLDKLRSETRAPSGKK